MDFKLKKSNLNLKVYSAAKLPSTGNENDIVIVSSTPMKNWILSPDEPNGAPRTDGDVWIKYSVKYATFNALKQGSMMIAMMSAYQYVDGAWRYVEAKSYQNGTWVEWFSGELYKNGNTYENITGGWGAKSVGVNSSYQDTGAVPTVTYNSDSVTISIATGKSGLWHTKNKISLAGKTKLSVQLSDVARIENSQAYLQIRTGVSGYVSEHSEVVGSATFIHGNTQQTSATIDLSSLSLPNDQTYYVCIGIYSGVSCNVNEIKLS